MWPTLIHRADVDKLRNAIALGTSPIVRGLVDYEGAMQIIRELDSVSFQSWFLNHGGSLKSIERMWNPIYRFVHWDGGGIDSCSHSSTFFKNEEIAGEQNSAKLLVFYSLI